MNVGDLSRSPIKEYPSTSLNSKKVWGYLKRSQMVCSTDETGNDRGGKKPGQ